MWGKLANVQYPPGTFGTQAEYVNGDLMDDARAYYAWIAERLASHVHGDVLEVGPGVGNGMQALAALPGVRTYTAVDCDPVAATRALAVAGPSISVQCADFAHMPNAAYDTVVSANTLEHIQDDQVALRSMFQKLRPGGSLALLVPAHPWLYSTYDHEAGHYRRYTVHTLREVLVSAGFTVDSVGYFNMSGAVGWGIVNRLWQRRTTKPQRFAWAAGVFARFFLPWNRWIESRCSPPFGLSVIGLAHKPIVQQQA